MPELFRNSPHTGKEERLFFCHVPRCAGRSIIKMMELGGWRVDYDLLGNNQRHATYFELRLKYKETKEPRSFAIVRHPMRRLESAFRENERASSPNEMFRIFEEMPIEKIYTAFNRRIRPAADFVLDNAEVMKLDAGFPQIHHELIMRGWLPRRSKDVHLGKTDGTPIDWTKAPAHIVDKIMQVYAQDFYHFEYQLFPNT